MPVQGRTRCPRRTGYAPNRTTAATRPANPSGKAFDASAPNPTVTFLRSIGAVAAASGDGLIDWDAALDAATAATPPGSIELDADEQAAIADDVRAAHAAIEAASGSDFAVPSPVEVQNRHHWMEANVDIFRQALGPLEDRPVLLPGVAGRVNTATMATLLSVLGRYVLGQYDPRLFDDGPPRLYFVLPNLRHAATVLDVEEARFRRWIAFHEVAHAAEFEAAPWLVPYLEGRIERTVAALGAGDIDTGAIRDLDAAMTAVEGYAEFVMDRAFDDRADDLREKLDARRRSGGPLLAIVRRLLGLGLKRRQYERGKAFFDAVAEARGEAAVGAVWRDEDALPRPREIENPERWIARVDP